MKIELLGLENKKTPSEIILNSANTLSRKKQLNHELWLLSCYVNFGIIKKLVKELKNIVKLSNVYLIFNFSEIFNTSPKKTNEKLNNIKRWCKKNRINFEWEAVSHSSLIHAKGYSLIQMKREEINDGIVLITSGNLTKNGFYGKNIEIGFSTNKVKQIKEFVSSYDHLSEYYNRDISDKVLTEEKHTFRYSLLSSGFFLHKWSDSLKQELGIKYKLTDYAKQQVNISEELAQFGVDTGDTFSLQIINTTKLPKKNIPKQFSRLYTVDTYWGRWCTKEIWNEVTKYLNDTSNFIESFYHLTSDIKLQGYKIEALEKQLSLYNSGFIKKNEASHVDSWLQRIIDLRENTKKLERVFTGYNASLLPYSYENTQEIEELYENMMETVNLSKRPNLLSRKILESEEYYDYGNMELNVEEKESLREMLINT